MQLKVSHTRAVLRRLGWFYGIALAISAFLLWAFAEVAEEVIERSAEPINRTVLLTIHGYASPSLEWIALGLTTIGSIIGIAVVSLAFGAWLYRRRRLADLATLVAAVGGSAVLTYALKTAFRQERPVLFPSIVKEVTYSFPSGHSLASFCLYGFIAWCVVARAPLERWRWGVAAACVALAALIALSRLVLGVHWPTDVLAGAIVATLWLTIVLAGRRWLTSRLAGEDAEGVGA